LEKVLEWPIVAIFRWSQWIANPPKLISQCLSEGYQNDTPRLIKDYWTLPIFISVAVEAIVLTTYNIDLLSTPALLLIYLLSVCLRSFIAIAILFALLKMFHIRSDFGVVAICYTIAVVYAPVFSAFEIPSFSYSISILSKLKLENVSPYDLVTYLIQHNSEFQKSNPQYGPLRIFSDLAAIVFLISNMLVAECLAQALSNDRFKTYAAVWLASVAGFVPSIVLNLFRLYSLWHYIK